MTIKEKEYRRKHKKCMFCVYAKSIHPNWFGPIICTLKGKFFLNADMLRLCRYYEPDYERRLK